MRREERYNDRRVWSMRPCSLNRATTLPARNGSESRATAQPAAIAKKTPRRPGRSRYMNAITATTKLSKERLTPAFELVMNVARRQTNIIIIRKISWTDHSFGWFTCFESELMRSVRIHCLIRPQTSSSQIVEQAPKYTAAVLRLTNVDVSGIGLPRKVIVTGS